MKIAYKNHNRKIFKARYGYEIDSEVKDINVNREIFGSFDVSYDGNNYTAFSEQDEENIYVFIAGKQFTFRKVDVNSTPLDSKDEGSEVIHAPMPGSVVKVLVQEGDYVEVGTPVLVIEAMKMESTLYADIKGIVSEINVEVKEQVSADKVLMRIKPNKIV